MPQYIALLRKDPDSEHGVDFPDFPGCVTAGKTLDEARRLAEEALRFHVEGMIEDGEALPQPRSLDGVMADPDNQDAVAFLVDVPQQPPRKLRVNVTLPENALRRIDAYARSHGLSRSAFLARAALETIARRP
ncbi:MAG: type II toxin-antitoxin system HicB family antitoxin [bacterium]|nr:type II toxin-antitoxin system HicB family antitoxin [bacterium]